MTDSPSIQSEPILPPPGEGKKFAPRAFAYILDVLLLFALNSGIGFLAGIAFFLALSLAGLLLGFRPEFAEGNLPALNLIIGVILSVLYFSIFEASYGASPGKILLRMRVVSMDGRPPPLDKAGIRAAWRIIDGLFFGLVAASSMRPPPHQRYGDKRAGTFVVRSDSPLITYRPSYVALLLATLAYCAVSAIFQVIAALPFLTISPSR